LVTGVEDIFLVAIVRVEGSSSDAGTVEYLLDGDLVEVVLLDEIDERAAQRMRRPRNARIRRGDFPNTKLGFVRHAARDSRVLHPTGHDVISNAASGMANTLTTAVHALALVAQPLM